MFCLFPAGCPTPTTSTTSTTATTTACNTPLDIGERMYFSICLFNTYHLSVCLSTSLSVYQPVFPSVPICLRLANSASVSYRVQCFPMKWAHVIFSYQIGLSSLFCSYFGFVFVFVFSQTIILSSIYSLYNVQYSPPPTPPPTCPFPRHRPLHTHTHTHTQTHIRFSLLFSNSCQWHIFRDRRRHSYLHESVRGN